jgi:predicted nucleic acid-binding protein
MRFTHARILAEASGRGRSLDAASAMLCGVARARGLTLITLNQVQLSEIADLSLIDWSNHTAIEREPSTLMVA